MITNKPASLRDDCEAFVGCTDTLRRRVEVNLGVFLQNSFAKRMALRILAPQRKQKALYNVRSGIGVYAGAARRRVHLATVLPRPPSGHRPGRRQARHARILQIGLHLKHVYVPSAWSSPSDLEKKEADGQDPPQGVAPHAHRGAVGTHELCR